MTITSTAPTVAALRETVQAKVAQGMRFAGVFAACRDGVLTLSAHVAGPDGIDTLEAPLPQGAASYPALTPAIGAAFWYERVIHDKTGVVPEGHPRLAPLTAPGRPEDHALPRHVAGYGMFTIPHGPVRSGVLESMEYLVETPGEAIPHLNMRIFYKHRGIAARFDGMTVSDGVLLAERAEGIASVGHALAYCHAVEAIAGCEIPREAALVRVVHAELERIANHLGVALTGSAVGNQRLVAIGLLAATLQMVTHTAAKCLLFSSAVGIEAAAGGTDDLEVLRGMGRLAPWSGAGPAVGSLTLAGLPPTAGFVSEWFLLESLMQQFRVTALGGRLTLAVAGAAVALTAGFAGVTFVRLVGMVVLGPPVSGGGSRRGEYGWAGRGAVVLLAACPLVIAALTPLEIRVIAAGLSPVVPSGLTMGALKSPLVLQPVFAGFSILSPSWLWIEMPVMLALVALLTFAVSGWRPLRVRRVPAWRSATIGVDGADSYTPFGYANPTRRVLASVLHPRTGVEELTSVRGGATEGYVDRVPHLRYASDVVEVVESWLYRPAARLFAAVVAAAQRLQSGRLDAYLLYMLIVLVAVIAVVTALA
jgi:hypothetical protein